MKTSDRKNITPDFISKSELAAHLDCDIHTIDRWIIKGTLPPPHARLGKRHAIWVRKHYLEFMKTGQWPRAAWSKD
jgi:predicted DNA-binding transcriptional regulator AlpA